MSCRPFLFLFDGCMLACCPFLLARGRRSPSPRKPTTPLLPTAAAASVQRTPRMAISRSARRRRDHGAVAFLGLAAAPSPSRFLDPDDPEQRLESNGRMQELAAISLRCHLEPSLARPAKFLARSLVLFSFCFVPFRIMMMMSQPSASAAPRPAARRHAGRISRRSVPASCPPLPPCFGFALRQILTVRF